MDEINPNHILDLYCGFGITSLLIAKKGKLSVKGVEVNGEAIRFAKENRDLNKLKNVEFIRGDVEKIIPRFTLTKKSPTDKKPIDFIIVNPPREGLTKQVIQTLIEIEAESLIYISCMPSTLARDLHLLSEKYEIKQGKIYDMFPQTAHVETLVYLKKRKLNV